MRNKNTHSLTIKGKLNKKKGVFVAFNQLQFKYGQLLDKDDEIVEIQANYSLKDFSFGNNYTSDFVCKKSNGELKIRECIYRKNIMKPSVIKLLDHVHAGVVESVPAALRAITGNGVNVLAMGAFYVAPQMGCDIADAYLNAELGSGYEWWHNFYEFHKLAIDELEAFNYEEYKKNGFKMKHLGDYDLTLETKPDDK